MEEIIKPVEKELLLAELTPERKFQDTNKGGNELYIFEAAEAPALMREVGRLREEAFRNDGACSGRSMDVDEFDSMDKPYKQLIVWDPDNKEIIGGYRFIMGKDIQFHKDGTPRLATADLFNYSEDFIKNYLPYTIELGRSFVSLGYQSSKAGAKALFALDNLWDGITAIIMAHPTVMYLFGKVTIHPSYKQEATDILIHFMEKHFGDKDNLVTPKYPVKPGIPTDVIDLILKDDNYAKDYTNLKSAILQLGSSIPPLINSYMSLSPTMKYFGFAPCNDLKGAIEGGILICFDEIIEAKKERHIKAFLNHNVKKIKKRFPRADEDFLSKNLIAHWNRKRQNALISYLRKRQK